MKLDVQTIKALNPCADRFDNFLKHYPDFSGTVEDFVMLENITYNDKIWVLTRVMNREQKVAFAIKCGLSMLSVFEQQYPSDDRPRKALEAAEAWLANPTAERAAAYATYTAGDAADAAAHAAYTAANAAYVVADAANATTYAADAAANAANAAANAAYAAAYATANATTYAAACIEQKELSLIFALETLKQIGAD